LIFNKNLKILNRHVKVIFYFFVIKLMENKHTYNMWGTVSQFFLSFQKNINWLFSLGSNVSR
jgi:hypothetical protein